MDPAPNPPKPLRVTAIAIAALALGGGCWAWWWLSDDHLETPPLHLAALLAFLGVGVGAWGVVLRWRGGFTKLQSRAWKVGFSLSAACALLNLLTAERSASPNAIARLGCKMNAITLFKVMRMAEEEPARFPGATNWCDVLKAVQWVTGWAQCLSQPGLDCAFAYNARLAGKPIDSVPTNSVFIVESRLGWNVAGGPEVAMPHPHSKDFVGVVFVDGSWRRVPLKDVPSLRWNP